MGLCRIFLCHTGLTFSILHLIYLRFLLQLTLCGSSNNSTGVLDVVETNPFKHLIHLSLKFVPGNDEEIKKYLAKCLKVFKVDQSICHFFSFPIKRFF